MVFIIIGISEDTAIVIDNYVEEINLNNMLNIRAIVGKINTIKINVVSKKQTKYALEFNIQSSELSGLPCSYRYVLHLQLQIIYVGIYYRCSCGC